MGEKISEKGKITQTKVGYIGIFKGDNYGQRDVENGDGYAVLYEGLDTCLTDNKNKDNFVTVATVSWEE